MKLSNFSRGKKENKKEKQPKKKKDETANHSRNIYETVFSPRILIKVNTINILSIKRNYSQHKKYLNAYKQQLYLTRLVF